jgi:hypothetical protein
MAGVHRAHLGLWPEEEGAPDMRARAVGEEEGEAAYWFGTGRYWAVGCFGGWADLVPLASFLFSLFLFLFFF